MARAAAAALVLLLLASALVASGCGEDESAAAGATVHIYASASLCPATKRAVAQAGGKAGDLAVQVECGEQSSQAGKLSLATLGANARAATQDSTAVAFLETPGKPTEFTKPIVEEAGIAFVQTSDPDQATHRVLQAISEAGGSGSLRTEVLEALE